MSGYLFKVDFMYLSKVEQKEINIYYETYLLPCISVLLSASVEKSTYNCTACQLIAI